MTTSDRKRPASGKRDSEREMSSLGDVRQVKVGLATKIALPVSGLAALVIVVFGMTVYSRLADGLDEELDRTGVFAARLAASPEIDSWVDSYNTVDDLRKRLADVEAEYAIARGVVGGAGTTAGEREIASKLARYDENQRAFNRRRLERLRGSEGALDVLIVNDKQELVATATGLRGAQIKPWHRRSVGDTVVESVAFAPTGGETVAARTFAHPILNRRKEEVGKATVVFSEENLEAQLADLRTKVAIFCVFGALAAGAVAFFTARGVTSPLKRLLKDIEAVAHGDLAHRTFARSHDEIGVVAATFDAMTRNLERAEGMRLDLADKEREVDIAREVQDRLFPAALPKPSGLLLDAKNRLAGDLSSDLFDVLPTPGPRVTLLTMTTAGRGVPAAIVLSMARSLARAEALQHDDPRRILIELNRLLSPDLKRGFFVSALIASVDPATGDTTVASAGSRAPALHFVAAQGGLRSVQPDGIALGMDKGPVFEKSLQESRFTLSSGDALLLATEGVFKLAGEDGKPLGDVGFKKIALAEAKAEEMSGLAPRVIAALEAKLGRNPGDFDATVVSAVRI
jgi:serine phosphatase RsbU (regulator of sigma subunit)